MGMGIWGTAYSESNMVKWASAMESLFAFNQHYEPQFVNFNTSKIPFDARWVSFFPFFFLFLGWICDMWY